MTLTAGCSDAPCFLDAGLSCSVCESILEPAALELGDGTLSDGFVEMRDGDNMLLYLGPGGLYMVVPSIRAWGIYPGEADRWGNAEDPKMRIDLYFQQTLVGGSPHEHVGLTVTADGAERIGIFAPFDVDVVDYVDLLGETITLRGEITDICGNTATDDLEVVLVQ